MEPPAACTAGSLQDSDERGCLRFVFGRARVEKEDFGVLVLLRLYKTLLRLLGISGIMIDC